MRLIDNWRRVLKRAWSVRILALAAVFSGLEVALPFFDGTLPLTDRQRGAVYFAVTVAALVARFLAQSTPTGEPHADKQASAD